MTAPKRTAALKRSFGQIDALPSGRFRARYRHNGKRHTAPVTFTTRRDADLWLASEQLQISAGGWTAPGSRGTDAAKEITVTEWVTDEIARRDLKIRTREHYARLIARFIAPNPIGRLALINVERKDVAAWFASMPSDKPTIRAHAYTLLRSAMTTAVDDGLITDNPCRVKNGTRTRRASSTNIATVAEIDAIAAAMPPRLALMVTLAGWVGLRFGELTELRRGDIDTARGVINVRRGVVRTDAGFVVGTPKSESGVRAVAIPPHLVPAVDAHLSAHVDPSPIALVFPAAGDPTGHLAPSTLYKTFYPAREAAGRPDLRFHDLRHTAGTRFAQHGATLKESMRLLGHGTTTAAIRYQHAAEDRMQELAARMSEAARRPTE